MLIFCEEILELECIMTTARENLFKRAFKLKALLWGSTVFVVVVVVFVFVL